MKMYDQRFPGITRFIQNLISETRTNGEVITPYLGRKQVAESSEAYKMVNYFVQGQAADVMKKKLLELSNTDGGQFMVMTVHDEIISDVPEEFVADVVHDFETVMPETEGFSIPITVGVDVVDSWGDGYK